MSNWADLNLPSPEAPAYLFAIDAGLQRTPFTTAKPRQRRKYETNRRNFTVEVLLTQAQLATAESFIQCYGYTWFMMPLLSGQDTLDVVSDHCVRLIDNFQVSAVGWNLYKLQMQLESLVPRVVSVTTVLYPLFVVDALTQSPSWAPTGAIFTTHFLENVAQGSPIVTTGALTQVIFYNYLTPQLDSVSQVYPSIPSGNLSSGTPPVYNWQTAPVEAIAQGAPVLPIGELTSGSVPEYLRYTAPTESAAQTAPTVPSGDLT